MKKLRSGCPIAACLDAVGDRWSLIIIRDLITGKRRFSQFLDSPERITPSVLTDRLNSLEKDGLILRLAYNQRPQRFEYYLTRKGAALLPVLQAMCVWGNEEITGTWPAPPAFMVMSKADLFERLERTVKGE